MIPFIEERLGFSANERAILQALKENVMAASVSRAARQAKIPRKTAEYILKKLEKRKLVIRVAMGGRFRWKYNLVLDRAVVTFKPVNKPISRWKKTLLDPPQLF